VFSKRVAAGGRAVWSTVTVTAADVAVLPAASRARAVSVCAPFTVAVVSQLIEYGGVMSSAPSGAPSRKNCTPAIPPSSDAVAVAPTVPKTVDPPVGEVIEAVGGVISGGNVTPLTPETSNASTTTKKWLEAGLLVPVTSTLSTCDSSVSPLAE
jgi:hypothetical protein